MCFGGSSLQQPKQVTHEIRRILEQQIQIQDFATDTPTLENLWLAMQN